MKKTIAILAVVALMAACMLTSVFAAEGTVVSVASVTATPGTTIAVPVSIEGNTGFDAAKMTITYDSSVLTLVNYPDFVIDPEFPNQTEVLENGLMNGYSNKGAINHASSSPEKADGVLFTAYFVVNEDAKVGEYEVSVTVNKLNKSGSSLTYTVEAGSVIVDLCNGNHNYVEEITVEANCCTTGIITYTCSVCGDTYTEEYYDNTNHTALEHHDAVAPADCWTDGNYEYWYCAGCDCYFLDSGCMYPVPRMSTIHPASHNVIHVEAKEPTCFEEGNVEYWYCDVCGSAWLDENLTLVTNLMSVKLGVKHNVIHVEAKEPTCTENGNIEYWYCDICGYAWLDEYCHLNTNLMAVILPAYGHDWEVIETVDPTCTEDGYITYKCKNCGETYTEVLTALGHIDEDGDEVCDRCGADLSNPKSGDTTISIAVAAVVISAMSVVALPVVKKHF